MLLITNEQVDRAAHIIDTAPIAGQVLNLRVTTEVGGILKPGGEILDIVPDDGALIKRAAKELGLCANTISAYLSWCRL